jgi:type VI protein secretion system component VasK
MKEHLDILGIGLQAIFTAIQTDEVLRWISFGFTLLSVILTIAYNIWRWYRKSKEDGKISMDEVDELVDIVKDGSDSLKNITKEENNDTRGNGEKTK